MAEGSSSLTALFCLKFDLICILRVREVWVSLGGFQVAKIIWFSIKVWAFHMLKSSCVSTPHCANTFSKTTVVELLWLSIKHAERERANASVNVWWSWSVERNAKLHLLNPLSTRPHQDVVWYNNSWLDFLKILNYVPKERENYTAKIKPSFVTVKCYDGS